MVKKNKKKIKNKKFNVDKHIILISLLLVMAIFILILITIQYNRNNDVSDKIVVLDNLNEEILLLKNNYDVLLGLEKKIDEITDNNRILNSDIEKITNSIKELDSKIAQYKK